MKSTSFLFTLLISFFGLVFMAGLVCIAIDGSQTPKPGETGFSAPSLFNQGNAFARQGKTGQAIASYERAKMLDPGDANIIANLSRVREKAAAPTPSESWLANVVGWASPNTWAWVGCLGVILIGASSLVQIAFNRVRFLTYGGIVAGISLVLLCLVDAYTTALKTSECVVVTPNTAAHVSPTTNGETSFKLNPGQIVTWDGEYQEFVLIADSDGRTGWVNKSDIIPIIPKT